MKMYYYYRLLLLVGLFTLTQAYVQGQGVFNGAVTDISAEDQQVLDEQFSDYSVFTMDQASLVSFMRNQTGVFDFELNVGGHQWQVEMEEGFSNDTYRVLEGGRYVTKELGPERRRSFKGTIVNQAGFSNVRLTVKNGKLKGIIRFEDTRYDIKPVSDFVSGANEDLMVLSTKPFAADWATGDGDGGADCAAPVMEFLVIADYSTYQWLGNETAVINHVETHFFDAMNEVYIQNFNLEFLIRGGIIIHTQASDFAFSGTTSDKHTKLNGYWEDRFGCAAIDNSISPVDAIFLFHSILSNNAAAGEGVCNDIDIPTGWVGVGASGISVAHEIGHIFGLGELQDYSQYPDLCIGASPCSDPNGAYLMCNNTEVEYPGYCLSDFTFNQISAKINNNCGDCFAQPDLSGETCLECWIGIDLAVSYETPLVVGCDGHSEVEYTMKICNNFCESQDMDVTIKFPTNQLEMVSGEVGFVDCTGGAPSLNTILCEEEVVFEPGECKEYVFVLEAIGVNVNYGYVGFAGGFEDASSGMSNKSAIKKIYDPAFVDDLITISGNISNLIGTELPASPGPCYSGAEELQLRITDDLIIDQDYCFGNYSTIVVDPGVKITIQDGAKLYLILTDLLACGEIWDGIEIEDGGNLYMRASSISNAEKAITAFDGAQLELYYNDFVDNYRGLYVPPNPDGNNIDVWGFLGNTFNFINGPGMPPLPGYPTGVLINDVSFISIQGNKNVPNDQGLNYFHHMNNGIVANNSNLAVSGCRFENIYAKAVHVKGDPLMTNMFSYEGGRGSYGQDIKDCTFGIMAERVHTDIASVELESSRYALTLKNLVNGIASVQDCQLSKVKDYGVQLTNNHLLEGNIEGNIIISDIDEEAAIGIEINGAPFVQSVGWNIYNNVIWMPGPHVGIKTTAGGNDLIGNNTISNLFSSVPSGFVGLSISGSADVTVTCNEVTGSGAEAIGKMKTSPLLGKGIYVTNAPGVSLSCNTLDEVQVGVNFWMTSVGADLSGNTFNNHDQGLLLGRYFTNFSSGWADIGLQEHRGNLWPLLLSGGSGSGVGAKHLSTDLDEVENSFFFVDPVNEDFVPSSDNNAGANWFQNFDDFGTTYNCEDISNNTCPEGIGYQGFTGGGSSDFENKIASGTLQPQEFTDTYVWLAERQLFNRIQQGQLTPEMGASFSNFQGQNQQSAIGRFDQAKSDLSQLFELGSGDKLIYRNDLQAIKSTIDSLVELNHLIQITPEGNDSLDYVNQKAARLASLHSLQSDLSTKAQLNLTQIENRKNNLTTGVDNLSSDAIYKSNEKTVNQIYLSFLGEDAGVLVDAQIASLLYIAEQCPLVGGNAVFEARSLLALSTDRYVFDDDVFCDQGGRRSDESLDKKVLNQVFSIYPNPAKDNIELSYQLTEEGDADISIQTRMGQVILNEKIAGSQEGVKRFDLDMLPAGVYFCSVRQNGQLLYIEKFVVIK